MTNFVLSQRTVLSCMTSGKYDTVSAMKTSFVRKPIISEYSTSPTNISEVAIGASSKFVLVSFFASFAACSCGDESQPFGISHCRRHRRSYRYDGAEEVSYALDVRNFKRIALPSMSGNCRRCYRCQELRCRRCQELRCRRCQGIALPSMSGIALPAMPGNCRRCRRCQELRCRRCQGIVGVAIDASELSIN